MGRRAGATLALAVVGILLLPSTGFAQSAIAGVVKDSSGAVMPGVTVEAASPALIEKDRSVATDDRGAYQIVDLRPGTYTVTFTLQGFATVKREGLELPSNFTATVNAELRVGALEETVTVSGASPVVDVQSTAKAQVLNHDVLDSIPTGRTAQTAAALVPGVIMGTPDVAGSNGQNQNASIAHGMAGEQATVLLDGIQLNGMCGNGATQSYSNTQNYEEIVVQNSGAGADVSAGGVRQYLVPRKGGNQFHGSGAAVYASGKWQADPLSPDLVARGLKKGNAFASIYDFETGMGGKFLKDKLWWFGATRKQGNNDAIADSFYRDGTQAVNEQYIKNFSMRLTWQVNPRNQLNVYSDRVFKYLSNVLSAGYDPATAGMVTLPSPLYEQSQLKWTSTLSSKLLIEAGFNQYQAYRTNTYNEGVAQPYGSPGWFAGATRRDLSTGVVTTANPITLSIQDPTRRFLDGSVSYVTGTHNIKVGVQNNWGYEWFATYKNADLEQNYQNGVPTSVYIFNSPTYLNNAVDSFLGLYGQDSWTHKRLTINYGLRWEYFRASIPQEVATKGRFTVADRSFGPETFPIWKDWAPRFGVVYDVFGTAKTAIKFSVNKYLVQLTDNLTNSYNPIRLQSATLQWTDLNRDDIAQGSLGCVYLTAGCEINMAQLPNNFGAVSPGCSVQARANPCGTSVLDPDRKRGYSIHYGLGVQHELFPRVSVAFNYFRADLHDLGMTYNAAQSVSDYTPVQVVSPKDGSVVTIYNVSNAARTRVLNLQTNDPNARKWNNALEFALNARLPRGVTLFGGVSSDRTLQIACGDPTNPNNVLYCDQTKSGVPWLTNVKLAGSIRLPFGVSLGASFQSYRFILSGTGGTATPTTTPGGTSWLITPTTRYAANCIGPCTPGAVVDPGLTVAQFSVPLAPTGTELSDRIKQLDVNVGKWFDVGRGMRIQPEVTLFNALDNLAVYNFRSLSFGTSSYYQPSAILPPRILRLGMQVKW
jgi:hypothetical protein